MSARPPLSPPDASILKNRLLLTVTWGVMIAVVSLLPGRTLPSVGWDGIFGTDKLAHMAVYAVWAWLWVRYVRASRASAGRRRLWGGILFMGLFGALMEVAQWAWTSDRCFEVPDIVANIIGAFGCPLMINLLKKLD